MDLATIGSLGGTAVLVAVIGYLLNSNRQDREVARADRAAYEAAIEARDQRSRDLQAELERERARASTAEERAYKAEYRQQFSSEWHQGGGQGDERPGADARARRPPL